MEAGSFPIASGPRSVGKKMLVIFLDKSTEGFFCEA